MKYPRINRIAIAIVVPLIVLIIVGLGLALPRILVKPGYNFIYTHASSHDLESFSVSNGTIVTTVRTDDYYGDSRTPAKLFLYDVTTNTSKELNSAEIAQYKILSETDSPDGYSVTTGRGSDSFSMGIGETYYESVYIRNSWINRKLSIKSYDSNYYAYFDFLGWVAK